MKKAKKPVKRVKPVKPAKRARKVSKTKRDRDMLAQSLSRVMMCVDRMENDRKINQSNVARDLAILVAAISRIEKAQRELNLAGWPDRMGNRLASIQEKMARIDWVHLMLAKVIAPLLHDIRNGHDAACIPSHHAEEIKEMAHRATQAGIDG